MHAAYLTLLIAAPALAVFRILFVCHRDETALVVSVAVVVLNWIANTGWVIMTGDTNPVAIFMATDLASMGVLSFIANCPYARTLGTTYTGQIALHVLHLLGAGDPLFYWELLTAIGYLQLCILAAWSLSPARRRQLEDWAQ